MLDLLIKLQKYTSSVSKFNKQDFQLQNLLTFLLLSTILRLSFNNCKNLALGIPGYFILSIIFEILSIDSELAAIVSLELKLSLEEDAKRGRELCLNEAGLFHLFEEKFLLFGTERKQLGVLIRSVFENSDTY